MPVDILFRYSGASTQPSFSINGGGDHLQIVVLDPDTKEMKILWTGPKFSQEAYLQDSHNADHEHRYLAAIGFEIPK